MRDGSAIAMTSGVATEWGHSASSDRRTNRPGSGATGTPRCTPTTGPEYPEALRTRAWALKALNTQLASWTQLRHDTVLYAKQSYTGVPLCEYPAGYVEPVPRFWARLERLAGHAATLLEKTSYPDYPVETMTWERGRDGQVKVVVGDVDGPAAVEVG